MRTKIRHKAAYNQLSTTFKKKKKRNLPSQTITHWLYTQFHLADYEKMIAQNIGSTIASKILTTAVHLTKISNSLMSAVPQGNKIWQTPCFLLLEKDIRSQ